MKLSPSILSVGSALALQGFALLTFMLLARLLDAPQLGAWALWLTFAAIADMTRQGLVQNGLVKFSANGQDNPGWFTAGFVLNGLAALGLGLLLMAIGGLAGPLFSMPELGAVALWGLPVFLLQSILRFGEAVQISRQDFRGVFVSNILTGGTQFLCTGFYFLKNKPLDLVQLIGFQAIGTIFALLMLLLFFKKYFSFGKWQPAQFQQLWQFGRHVAGTNFFSMLFQRLDVLLIGVFLTPASVAVYNVATRLNSLLDLPLNSLSQVQYPKAAAAYSRQENPSGIFKNTLRSLLKVQTPLCLLMIAGAPWAVDLLAGDAYAAATPMVQVLAFAALVKPWGRSFGLLLDAAGKPQVNFKMLVFSFVINLSLCLALIPFFGAAGAAWAAGLGVVLTTLVGQALMRKIFDIPRMSFHFKF